ncbi:glycoside hydrolase [Lophiotrema nucula]|uniref:lytic cellulose monooxygenase (C4-dehydrogenating) n=1 Tax=Lophiotrema nucula TaxID=690887 RepID=A0A6A5YSH6_9PLEO|nr:glycoside hydrolase [Lophiotrema nucula]
MKIYARNHVLFSLLGASQAHYVFNRLVVNNTISAEFQYVRDVNYTATPPLWGKTFPLYDVWNPDLVCGRNATKVLNADIQTATILAGSEVGFMVSGPWYEGDPQQYIFHEGPGQAFLSKLPETLSVLKDYDGSGDWFKIAYAGPANDTTWSLYNTLGMNFTIPKATPSGKYLMRMEHILPHSRKGEAQFFVNCAHVEIVGGVDGSGAGAGVEPGPTIRFPNAYKIDEPGIWFHDGTTNMSPANISTYQQLAPAVWTGQ